MSIKEFVKDLSSLDHSKSTQEKFRDFCELGYCAYARLTTSMDKADELEKRYMQIVSTYSDKDAIRAYPRLLGMVWQGVEQDKEDFLGVAATEIGALNASQGQFFTPIEISQLMAQITLNDAGTLIKEKGYITFNEPASGSGGMILAVANTLEKMGFDPANHMLVCAQDISQICYHMCFLQLVFRGIPALVERRNTLSMELFESAWTPAAIKFSKEHRRMFSEN